MTALCVDRCVVPPITVSTPLLDYGRCFLHHPYELLVNLVNESDLPAKYELLSQVYFYTCKFSHGYIQHRSFLVLFLLRFFDMLD